MPAYPGSPGKRPLNGCSTVVVVVVVSGKVGNGPLNNNNYHLRPLSRTTLVSRYQKKHLPTHHPDHHTVFVSFFHLPRSIASSLFIVTHPPDIPYISSPSHSSRTIMPMHCNLFCCSINIISSIPSLSLNSLLGTLSITLTLHIHLTILVSAR